MGTKEVLSNFYGEVVCLSGVTLFGIERLFNMFKLMFYIINTRACHVQELFS